MDTTTVIFYILVLIMSVIVHEVAHGYAASYLGDQTARMAGRLTLNPLKHLDLFGSFIVPLFLYIVFHFPFGWAKPVPYNPNNFTDKKKGTMIVASAGIIANLCLVVFFSILIRFAAVYGAVSASFIYIASLIVLVNIALAVFNILPIPPLDGSRILFAALPSRLHNLELFLDRYGFFLLLVIVFFAWQYIAPLVFGFFSLVTGLH